MKKLKNIEHVVEKILESVLDARKNDDILYLCVCEHCYKGTGSITVKDFLTIRSESGYPSFASVTRARRKIFERRPELKPKEITELREVMREIYVDYAING